MLKKLDRKFIIILFSILVAFSVYLCYMPNSIASNNMVYAIGQIHAYDNSIYSSNIAITDSGISPRLLFEIIFSFFMHLTDGKWINVAVPFLYGGALVLAIGTVLMAFNISKKYGILLTPILAFFFAKNVSAPIGGFDTFNLTSLGFGTGYAFAIVALAFVIGRKKYFNFAWISLAISTICHIQEGVYGFAVIFILIMVELFISKHFSFKEHWCSIFFFLVLIGTVIPNLLTDTLNISSEEFINIYARIRAPGHLLPSAWDKKKIIFSFLMILFPALFRVQYLLFNKKTKLRKYYLEMFLFLSSWWGALTLMYVFTEIIPISVVCTMFVSKYFKYVGVISIIWYLKTFRDYLEKKQYLIGVEIISFAGLSHLLSSDYAPTIFLIVIASVYYLQKIKTDKNDETSIWGIILGCVPISILLFVPALNLTKEEKIILLMIAVILILVFLMKKITAFLIKPFILISSLGLLFFSMNGDLYRIENRKLMLNRPSYFLINSAGEDIYQLSLDFKYRTEKDAIYLADSDAEISAGWMEIISERSCFALWKVTPSSKSLMEEWYNRCLEIRHLFDKSSEDIYDIMIKNNIEFLLVDSNNYGKIDSSMLYSVFSVCDEDSYRIYKIVK